MQKVHPSPLPWTEFHPRLCAFWTALWPRLLVAEEKRASAPNLASSDAYKYLCLRNHRHIDEDAGEMWRVCLASFFRRQATLLAERLLPMLMEFEVSPGRDTWHWYTVQHKPASKTVTNVKCVHKGWGYGSL